MKPMTKENALKLQVGQPVYIRYKKIVVYVSGKTKDTIHFRIKKKTFCCEEPYVSCKCDYWTSFVYTTFGTPLSIFSIFTSEEEAVLAELGMTLK